MQYRNTYLVMGILLLVTVVLAWNYWQKPLANVYPVTDEIPEVITPMASPSLSEYEEWVATASSRQKIAQLIVMPVVLTPQTSLATVSAEVATVQPGWVAWFGTNISVASVSAARENVVSTLTGNNPRPLFVVDHEGGTVQRLRGAGFTVLPSWRQLCTQPATVSAQTIVKSAQELRAAGIDTVWAPMADVATNHPVLGSRVCSDDPAVVVERVNQWIDSFDQAGVQSVIKHFPGIGKTTRDLHTSFDQVTVEPSDAAIYQSLLDTHPEVGVMVSHVGVTNQFADKPCSLSTECVGQLRANYPQALLMSDALEMKAAAYQPSGPSLPLVDVARQALEAGNHVLVFGASVTADDLVAVIDTLAVTYDTNQTLKVRVDQALSEVAAYRQGISTMGVEETPYE